MINKNGNKVPSREPEAEGAEPAVCKNGINVIYFSILEFLKFDYKISSVIISLLIIVFNEILLFLCYFYGETCSFITIYDLSK